MPLVCQGEPTSYGMPLMSLREEWNVGSKTTYFPAVNRVRCQFTVVTSGLETTIPVSCEFSARK
jgi:hypothetical protein